MRKEIFGTCEMLLGDCMDYMATLPDKAFDLAIVDPPYGGGHCIHNGARAAVAINSNVTKGGYFDAVSKPGVSYVSVYGDKINEWDNPPPSEYFQELFRVSKEQIIWGGNYFELPPSRNFIIWDKLNGENWTMAMAEYAWTSIFGNARVFRLRSMGLQGERFHPTQKPVALYKWLLAKYAKPGWRILDTHGGSFASAVACYEAGFEYVGIELDAEYFKKAVKRMKNIVAQGFLIEPKPTEPAQLFA